MEQEAVGFPEKAYEEYETCGRFGKGGAVAFSLILADIVVGGLLILVLPRLVESVKKIIDSVPTYIVQVQVFAEQVLKAYPDVELLSDEAYNRIMEHIESWISTDLIPQMNILVTKLTSGILGVFSSLFNLFIGIVVSVYVLMGQKRFIGQGKKILYALMKPEAANGVITIIRQSNRIFGGFISGKLIDSLIIGIICFIGLYFMKTPYMVLVSVIVGVTNIIPFFGPYIGAVPSALLILLVDWRQCIYFVVFIVILQQIDGNILGPKILGNSTGLSAFWVVFAILLGGGLFGFAGMLLGVPVFAVIYYMIKTYIEWRLYRKNLPTSTEEYSAVAFVEGKILVYQKEAEGKEGLLKKIIKKEKTETEEEK